MDRVLGMTPTLHTRSAHGGDMGYVISTWMRSYVGPYNGKLSFPDYRKRYVDKVLSADPHIVVLCSPEKHSALHGYAVALDGAIAWTYVVKDLRRQGYAREAMTAALRGYPDEIRTHMAWPFPSKRFRFERLERAA